MKEYREKKEDLIQLSNNEYYKSNEYRIKNSKKVNYEGNKGAKRQYYVENKDNKRLCYEGKKDSETQNYDENKDNKKKHFLSKKKKKNQRQ